MARNEVARTTLLRGRNVLSSRTGWAELDPPLTEPFPESTIVGDLADVIGGTVQVDYDPAKITVLSAGAPVSMWDVAAASAIYELCQLRGLGTELSLDE
jgi:ornithine cyclodeaminase/alanine dehydrogenase-like protein (mu-crystallin family)